MIHLHHQIFIFQGGTSTAAHQEVQPDHLRQQRDEDQGGHHGHPGHLQLLHVLSGMGESDEVRCHDPQCHQHHCHNLNHHNPFHLHDHHL